MKHPVHTNRPYILFEYSKNDPIPEINRNRKNLAIIMVGHAGSGKSTFVRNNILRLNPQTKVFEVEKASNLRSKKYLNSPKQYQYVSGTKRILIYAIKIFAENSGGQNLVYETTGNNMDDMIKVHRILEANGYKTVVIQMSTTSLQTAIDRVKLRIQSGGHGADEDYIREVWNKNKKIIEDITNKVKPDKHYLVTTDSEGDTSIMQVDKTTIIEGMETKRVILGVFYS